MRTREAGLLTELDAMKVRELEQLAAMQAFTASEAEAAAKDAEAVAEPWDLGPYADAVDVLDREIWGLAPMLLMCSTVGSGALR